MVLVVATNFRFWVYNLRTRLKFRNHRKSEIVNRKFLNSPLFRRPNHFVHLNLKADRQGIGNNCFRQFAP
jgi:hypothetical protein